MAITFSFLVAALLCFHKSKDVYIEIYAGEHTGAFNFPFIDLFMPYNLYYVFELSLQSIPFQLLLGEVLG